MNGMGVMSAGDWAEIVVKENDPETSAGGAPPVFGVKLHLGGETTVCFENDRIDDDHTFRRVFGFGIARKFLLPHHMHVVLVVCLVAVAPEILREVGFEVRSDGRVRVGSLGLLEGFFEDFASAAEALKDPEKERVLQTSLRLIFQKKAHNHDTLIGFQMQGGKRWMFPRVAHPGQIRIAADLLSLITERLRDALRPSAPGGGNAPKDDPLGDLIAAVTALVKLLHGIIGDIPEDKVKGEAARWLRRVERWIPRVLDAFKTPNGRTALMKLVMAVAFPRQRPTPEQVRELFEAMGREAEDALDTMREDAGRDAARDLCRDALRERFGPLPARVQDELGSATYGQLRRWLLRTLTARTLRDVFRPGSVKRAPAAPPSAPTATRPKKPSRPAKRAPPSPSRARTPKKGKKKPSPRKKKD